MDEENKDPKQSQQEDENEEKKESETGLAKDGQIKDTTISNHTCPRTEEKILCPEQIFILKALHQIVESNIKNEKKKACCKLAETKQKCPKRSKACRKRPEQKHTGTGDSNLSCEDNKNSVSETETILSGLACALNYLENAYNTMPSSTCIHPFEDTLDYGAVYVDEETAEVEIVAEVQVGNIGSYSALCSGILQQNHQRRLQKSAYLSTSGRQLKGGQSSVIYKETVSEPSRIAISPEHLRTPLTVRPCSTRTHRTKINENHSSLFDPHIAQLRQPNHYPLQKHPQSLSANVLPGLYPTVSCSANTSLTLTLQDNLCYHRTALIQDKTEAAVQDTSDVVTMWGLTLGNGTEVSSGQQRPLGGEGSTSNNPHSQPPNSLEKIDSSSSSSSSSTSHVPVLSGEGSGANSSRSQDLDIYDPFHPTDEENVNGDYVYADSPEKENDEQEDQKYDPFEPTGSNPSSSEHSPSPYEDDDDDDDMVNATHPEGLISEALAGIYDENSLSQEFPDCQKEKEEFQTEESDKGPGVEEHDSSIELDNSKTEQRFSKDPPGSATKECSKLDFEPYSPSSSLDLDRIDDAEDVSREVSEEKVIKESPVADSTLNEESVSEVLLEPRRRVFAVDVGKDYNRKTEFSSEPSSEPKLEIKVSLESVAKPDVKSYLRMEKIAKLGGESRSRHKQKRSSERRDYGEDSDPKYDSEIEEGEIVQPDEDRFSPMPLFRSRCRVMERPLRMVEGDDFLSLHADSDEEGALQIDFGDNQVDNRWKGLDLRRKITNQRRERYRKKSVSPSKSKRRSKSRSVSSSRSHKKAKRESKRSRERKRSKEPRVSTATWSTKKSKDSKDRKRSRSRSYHKTSRSRSRDHRRSRSWSPSISTSISAVGSSRTSAERRKSWRSKSKDKRRYWSRSASTDRSRKDKHKEKHRSEGKKKKKRSRSRSKDRERRSSRRSSDRRDRVRERARHPLDDAKTDNPPLLERRRRDSRSVVPPSIQDLNNSDLFTIKRTITVNPEEKLEDREDLLNSPEAAGKREVLYDSEGLSFEAYSDREILDDRDSKNRVFERHSGKAESSKRRIHIDFEKKRAEEEENRQKANKERDRKRSYTDDSRDRYKKRFKDVPDLEPEPLKLEKEKIRTEKDKTSKKLKASHREGKGGAARKVKLQSKVAVLIREGVSSTTSVKEAGSIGVKFSRDRESRSPFLKPEEKLIDKTNRPKLETTDPQEPLMKPKKLKGLKTKTGVKKIKPTGAPGVLVKPKGTLEKKKRKLKNKALLKKSKADSCSKELPSPIQAKDEPIWSDTETTESKVKPPSPPKPANEQELTPDSQTVDSSCKTPDVSFLPEEPPPETERSIDLEVDSISEPKEDPPRPPPAPMPWNLQSGVDCTTSGVLALTALLFKMEEANIASRAKAQELIQATNQILSQTKPSTSLVSQPPPPPMISSLGHSAPSYLLHSSLPLSSNSSPPTPPGISTLSNQGIAGSASSIFFSSSTADIGKREGSISSEGKGDTDKYLKKLHTQERAVEEVKLAIKPYYQRKEITKEDYKDILRKAVHKICHSKSGEINPVKVNNLVKAYVQRYKYFRKHGKKMDDEDSSIHYRTGKEQGLMDKGIPTLPLI
ncbi:splicing factor, arginine/serine-rich 19 [Bombina bombina]|uniref:splicing factor, arginine/serine-rich 19 n=1 Tax=Bombina bombina TaxID=8345 RepID=UPI00235A5645|nr:splicing factor, arginine/serine-rich 19 [Bombina bombina]